MRAARSLPTRESAAREEASPSRSLATKGRSPPLAARGRDWRSACDSRSRRSSARSPRRGAPRRRRARFDLRDRPARDRRRALGTALLRHGCPTADGARGRRGGRGGAPPRGLRRGDRGHPCRPGTSPCLRRARKRERASPAIRRSEAPQTPPLGPGPTRGEPPERGTQPLIRQGASSATEHTNPRPSLCGEWQDPPRSHLEIGRAGPRDGRLCRARSRRRFAAARRAATLDARSISEAPRGAHRQAYSAGESGADRETPRRGGDFGEADSQRDADRWRP